MLIFELADWLGDNFSKPAGKFESQTSLPTSSYYHCQAENRSASGLERIIKFYFQFRHFQSLNRIFIFGGRDENNSLNHKNYLSSGGQQWREIGINFTQSGRQSAGCLSAGGDNVAEWSTSLMP